MSTDLLTRDGPGSGQGGVWAYVSASRLGKWLSCPLAMKFQYIDGLRPPTTPSQFLGKVVHRGLEAFNRHRQLGMSLAPGDVSERMVASWDQWAADEKMKFTSSSDETALRQQAIGLVTTYLAQAPTEETPRAVEVALEAPLVDPETGENLGLPLVGILDLIVADAAGFNVVDFKTSARSSEPLEVVHEIQLSSYAYLLRAALGEEEGALEIRSLIKTKKPKIQFHRYPARTDVHFFRLFAAIREYLDALDRGRVVFRPGFGCSVCDFRESHCRQWAGA